MHWVVRKMKEKKKKKKREILSGRVQQSKSDGFLVPNAPLPFFTFSSGILLDALRRVPIHVLSTTKCLLSVVVSSSSALISKSCPF